jgi:hypothetical protein
VVVWRLHCMSSLGFEVQRAGLSVASDAQRAPAACDPDVDQFDPVDEVGSSARARRPMLRLGHQNTEVFGALTCLSLLRFRKGKKLTILTIIRVLPIPTHCPFWGGGGKTSRLFKEEILIR